MKTLDFTVIADLYCPTSRTYLSYLKQAGYQPEKILLTAFVSSRRKYSLIRRFLGYRAECFAAHLCEPGIASYPSSVSAHFTAMQESFGVNVDYTSGFAWQDYAPVVQKISALDYSDPDFREVLKKQRNKTFLYTNGGIVPKSLLEQKDIRILHIHPGIVPDVRGSDGLLWSVLIRGRPGVSCFYMSPGIDEGALIDTMEFAPMRIQVPAPNNAEEEDALYRAALIAYDPHLRARLLCKIIKENEGTSMALLPSRQQPPVKPEAYLWMHPALRKKVFEEKICA